MVQTWASTQSAAFHQSTATVIHVTDSQSPLQSLDKVAAGTIDRQTLYSWLGEGDADIADALLAQEFDTPEVLQRLTLDKLKQVLEEEGVRKRKLGALEKVLLRLDTRDVLPQDNRSAVADPRPSGRFKFCSRLLFKFSFEDAEALVNNLVVFSALIFAFSIQLYAGTFDHDDLYEADLRNARLTGVTGFLISVTFLERGYLTAVLMLFVIMLCLMTLLSLYLSNAREDPRAMARWAWFGGPVIVAAYIIAFYSCHLFIRTAHLAVEMIYPRYDPASSRSGNHDPAPYRSEGMTDDQAWALVYNSTSQILISMSPHRVGLHTSSLFVWRNFDFNFGLAWSISERMYQRMHLSQWTVVGIMALFAIAFWIYSAYLTGASEAASCTSPSVTDPSTAPAPQARTPTQPTPPEIATAPRRPSSRAPPLWT